jgi:hypothetical protein
MTFQIAEDTESTKKRKTSGSLAYLRQAVKIMTQKRSGLDL